MSPNTWNVIYPLRMKIYLRNFAPDLSWWPQRQHVTEMAATGSGNKPATVMYQTLGMQYLRSGWRYLYDILHVPSVIDHKYNTWPIWRQPEAEIRQRQWRHQTLGMQYIGCGWRYLNEILQVVSVSDLKYNTWPKWRQPEVEISRRQRCHQTLGTQYLRSG